MHFESFKCLVVFLGIVVSVKAYISNSTDSEELKGDRCGFGSECPENMECYIGYCQCNLPHILILETNKCILTSGFGEPCKYSEQCSGNDHNTICTAGYCSCHNGYERRNYRCLIKIEPSSQMNKDIYKAAMVALSCFVITVIGLFVLFLCNRSYLRRAAEERPSVDFDRTTRRRPSDIFNVSEELAAMRRIDKPPNYQDILIQDHMTRGMPPPAYNDIVDASTSTTGLSINIQPVEVVRGSSTSTYPTTNVSGLSTRMAAFTRLPRHTNNIPNLPNADNSRVVATLPITRGGADNIAFDNRE